nr:MAG TPA: hypothetical protein [Caudoviricetes sp.]
MWTIRKKYIMSRVVFINPMRLQRLSHYAGVAIIYGIILVMRLKYGRNA